MLDLRIVIFKEHIPPFLCTFSTFWQGEEASGFGIATSIIARISGTMMRSLEPKMNLSRLSVYKIMEGGK